MALINETGMQSFIVKVVREGVDQAVVEIAKKFYNGIIDIQFSSSLKPAEPLSINQEF